MRGASAAVPDPAPPDFHFCESMAVRAERSVLPGAAAVSCFRSGTFATAVSELESPPETSTMRPLAISPALCFRMRATAAMCALIG